MRSVLQAKIKLSNLSLHIELFFVVAIWAGTFVSTKLVLAEITPALSALYRYLIASIILIIIDFRNQERINREDYPLFLFLSATGVTLYYLLQHYGMQYTNATNAAILISLSPVFIGIFSWLLFNEKFKCINWLGLTLAFGGCCLLITDGNMSRNLLDNRSWGNLFILMTAISWALYSVYGKKLLKTYSSITIIKYTTLLGTIMLIPFSLGEITLSSRFALSWLGFVNLLYLGGLASVYGYLAWYKGLERLPAITVGSYLYFRPLLTGILAAAILHENISSTVILGGMLILAGAYLTTK
ncbi:DMT family transporter [Sporomusa aerivorans]|uniref:DMT family transporter n=1 Tax=Sporomusa aerivorans TaxID=204936 RepID=UPI00352ABB2B